VAPLGASHEVRLAFEVVADLAEGDRSDFIPGKRRALIAFFRDIGDEASGSV